MTQRGIGRLFLQIMMLTALVLLAWPDGAGAAESVQSNDLRDLRTNFGNVALLPALNLFNMGCYAGGVIMMVMGALKLKAHAESPGQEKLAPGIARLIVGGAITSVPAITNVIQSSNALGGNTPAIFKGFPDPGF